MTNRSCLTLILILVALALYPAPHKRDSLKTILQQHHQHITPLDDSTEVNILNQLAHLYFQSNTDSMKSYAGKALQKARKHNILTETAKAYNLMGIAHYARGMYEEAIDYYTHSSEIFSLLQQPTELANNYNNIAIIYDIRGDHETALHYYFKALEINKEHGFQRGSAYNLLNIGIIYYQMGRVMQALDKHLEALLICEIIDDANGMALIYNNLGAIYIELKKFDEGLRMNQKSYQIRKQLGDKSGMSSTLQNIADVHFTQHNLDSAHYYVERSAKLASQADDVRRYNITRKLMAKIMVTQQKYDDAQLIYLEIIEAFNQLGDQKNLALSLAQSAELQLRKGRVSRALSQANQAYQIGTSTDNQQVMQEANRVLADIHQAGNDFEKALFYYKSFTEISDSLNNYEIQRQSARLDAEYEYLKKEQELLHQQQEKELQSRIQFNRMIFISVLIFLVATFLAFILVMNLRSRKKIQRAMEELKVKNQKILEQTKQLKKQAKELHEANQTKSRLFSIIGHDLKGPLAYASMAIDMAQDKDEAYLKKNLPLIKNNIDNVYILMENLLEWARVQMHKETLQTENLKLLHVCTSAAMGLQAMADKKDISIDTSPLQNVYVEADKDMLELILRNLLSNAIKFSRPKDSITVWAESLPQQVRVCIEDRGVGIDPKDIPGLFGEKLVSRPGTAMEKGSGLGLKLCKELLEKNKGAIHIESEPGKGTRVFFTLPKGQPPS